MQLCIRPSFSSIIAAISSLILTLLYLGFFTSASAYVAYGLAAVLSLLVFGVWMLIASKTREHVWQPPDTQTHISAKKAKHK